MLSEQVLKWKFILWVFKVYGSKILHVVEIPEENILCFIVDEKTDLIDDMAAFVRKIKLPGLSVVAVPCYAEDSDASRYIIVELQYEDE